MCIGKSFAFRSPIADHECALIARIDIPDKKPCPFRAFILPRRDGRLPVRHIRPAPITRLFKS